MICCFVFWATVVAVSAGPSHAVANTPAPNAELVPPGCDPSNRGVRDYCRAATPDVSKATLFLREDSLSSPPEHDFDRLAANKSASRPPCDGIAIICRHLD